MNRLQPCLFQGLWYERREPGLFAKGSDTGPDDAKPSGGHLFEDRHFDREIFVLWMRWHLRY